MKKVVAIVSALMLSVGVVGCTATPVDDESNEVNEVPGARLVDSYNVDGSGANMKEHVIKLHDGSITRCVSDYGSGMSCNWENVPSIPGDMSVSE